MRGNRYYPLLFLILLLLLSGFAFASGEEETGSSDYTVLLESLWESEDYLGIRSNYRDDGSAESLRFFGLASYLLGRANADPSLFDEAATALGKFLLIEEMPDSTVSEALFHIYFLNGEYERAAAALKVVSNRAQSLKALAAYKAGLYSTAGKLLSELTETTLAEKLLLYRSSFLSGDMDPDAVLSEALDEVQDEISTYQLMMLLVNHLSEREQYGEARKLIEGKLTEFSSPVLLSSLYYNLGLILQRQGNIIEARTMWNRAREIDPRNAFAQEKL